jgi:hypothetical protein
MGLVYSPKYRVFIKTSYYQSVNFQYRINEGNCLALI